MKDLTKGNIYKTFLLFAIPMVLSSLLSQAYATINTVMAGKLLGDNALAATGALAPFNTFVNSVFWGYGMGVGIYISHLFGAGEYERIKRTVVNNFRFFLTGIFLLSCVFIFFRYEIYRMLKVDPAIIADCNRYFIIITAGKMFLMSVSMCVSVFNAIGDSAFPLGVSVLTSLLNIAVGAASVIFFHMGVEGLALGSVVAAVVGTTAYFFKLKSVFRKMQLARKPTRFFFSDIKDAGKYSVPTMIQQSIMYFAGLILSPMINGLGGSASASYTVSLRIYEINAAIYINSSKTVGSFTAQCYGAKKYNLMKKGIRVGALQSLVLVMPTLLACCFFAKPVTSLFYADDASAESVHYTVMYLRYFLPFLTCNVFANLFHNFFRGIGRMRALLITTIAGSVARIIISAILIVPFGIYGYYAGWVLSWVADGIVGIGIYFFGSWRKALIQQSIQ